MALTRKAPEPALLDLDVWDVPARWSDDELYVHAGADRRRGGHAADDLEDER